MSDVQPVPQFETEFEEEETDDDEFSGSQNPKEKYRFRWPQEVRDDVLARLLILNEQRAAAEAVLGPRCFAVRAILFDKTSEANWKVAWHQDLTIAARAQADVQLLRLKWLDDEIVGPRIQAFDNTVGAVVARQQDHVRVAARRTAADFAAEFDAIHFRHRDVAYHGVWWDEDDDASATALIRARYRRAVYGDIVAGLQGRSWKQVSTSFVRSMSSRVP